MKEFDNYVSLPEALKARLKKWLQKDEQVVWAAQPNEHDYQKHQGKVRALGIVWLTFISLICVIAFPGRMNVTGIIPPPYGFYFLFGLFFVIGLYLVTISFWSRFFANRTLYIITNKRVVLMGCWFRGNFIKFFEGKALRRVKVEERSDGTGDIILKRFRTKGYEDGDSLDEIGFLGIPNVQQVKRLIDSLSSSNVPS